MADMPPYQGPRNIEERICWRDLQGHEWMPREAFEAVVAERDLLREICRVNGWPEFSAEESPDAA